MVTQMMSRNWRDLIRPKAIQLDKIQGSMNRIRYVEELWAGFGAHDAS